MQFSGNAISIACWAKSANSGNWGNTAGAGDGTLVSEANSFSLGASDQTSTNVTFTAYIGGTAYTDTITPSNINAWNYYVATYDGSTMSLSVNNGTAKTVTQSGTLIPAPVPYASAALARQTTSTALLDEVRLYNSVLSSSAIRALYYQSALSVSSVTHGTVQSFALTTSLNSSPVSQYSDQSYTFTSSPTMDQFTGSTFIQIANADRLSTGSQWVGFTINTPCVVYILYDTAITGSNMANWLSDFTEVTSGGNPVQVSNSNGHYFHVYSKVVSSGLLWLGGNLASGATDQQGEMYTVILQPMCWNSTTSLIV